MGRSRWLALLTAGLCWGFFVVHHLVGILPPMNRPLIRGWDDSFYFFWLRAPLLRGDVDFARDLAECDSLPVVVRESTVRDTPRTPRGLVPNKYPVGWALVGLPWYVAADLTVRASAAWGHPWYPRDGWAAPYQLAPLLGQALYALLGWWCAFRVVKELVPGTPVLAGTLLTGLSSSLFYYQTLELSMAHNTMFCAVSGCCYAALRLRASPRNSLWWCLTGLSASLAVLSRYQGVVYLLFPAWVVGRTLVRGGLDLLDRAVLGAVAAAAPLALQMLAWHALYGSWFLYTYQGETFSFARPHLWEVLFSPYHGLFNWHPVMLIGFVGFAWWVGTVRSVGAGCLLVSLLLSVYVNASWDVWWFGASFGSRAFEGTVLPAALGVAFLLGRLMGLARAALNAGLILLAAANLTLAWLPEVGRMELERPYTVPERLTLIATFWRHPKIKHIIIPPQAPFRVLAPARPDPAEPNASPPSVPLPAGVRSTVSGRHPAGVLASPACG